MKSLVKHAQQYHTDRTVPVLIQGETGVGKEVIARIIHYGNVETPGPFVDINCAAISPTLFESELFGYEGGSFTGGVNKGQKGKFDIAAGGTLFLDEIVELPLELQAKLLRVLEEKSFYRIGGLKKIKTDVRIICTANLDFEKQIEDGKFRKDLYYRLKVGRILIPPLREREDDILPLTLMFLTDFSKRRGKHFSRISEPAAKFLMSYQWPGNVRELRNAMEWISFMFDDVELKFEHLSNLTPKGTEEKKETKSLPPDPMNLDEHIDDLVEEALRKYNGNKTKAAHHLGISVRALYYRLERMQKNVERKN
jgi:two-component system, NtrC family, response regulator AtoC